MTVVSSPATSCVPAKPTSISSYSNRNPSTPIIIASTHSCINLTIPPQRRPQRESIQRHHPARRKHDHQRCKSTYPATTNLEDPFALIDKAPTIAHGILDAGVSAKAYSTDQEHPIREDQKHPVSGIRSTPRREHSSDRHRMRQPQIVQAQEVISQKETNTLF